MSIIQLFELGEFILVSFRARHADFYDYIRVSLCLSIDVYARQFEFVSMRAILFPCHWDSDWFHIDFVSLYMSHCWLLLRQ